MTQLSFTSLEAYTKEIKPTLGQRQLEALEGLRVFKDATNSELAEYLKKPINTITPRVKELREKGKVVLSCVRVCKVTGRNVKAWKVKS